MCCQRVELISSAAISKHRTIASKRAYKDAWPQERIESVLREGAGTHLDPVIAALFVDNLDSINRIRAAVAHDSGT